MDRQLPDTKIAAGKFSWTYMQNAGKWQSCDWSTAFGTNQLDLKGLSAAQATLLCGATSGSEAAEWQAAAEWLGEVERDAKQAEAQAARAAELAEAGRLSEALRLAEESCVIEGRYHANLVWQALHQVIAIALVEQQRGGTA